MARITGIGGVFFESADPEKLAAWYAGRLGVEVDPKREDYDFGRFGWIMDPEGNRVELWEPARSVGVSP